MKITLFVKPNKTQLAYNKKWRCTQFPTSQHLTKKTTLTEEMTHSLKDISPSLFTSKSIKNSEGGQRK